MRTTVLTTIKNLGFLLQKAGPYLLLEILLPGGTIFALLLFLCQRNEQFDGTQAPPAGFAARIVTRVREAVDLLAAPIGITSAWRGRGRERDGLEALAIAPTM